jgi:uncharacterized repeat protein (TIGR03803 family)
MSKVQTFGVSKKNRGAWGLVLLCALLVATIGTSLHAQTYQDLVDLNSAYPVDYGQLTQWSDGNLYGTTEVGQIFMVTPSGAYTVVHTFTGVDGAEPVGALTLAGDGNLYGTALFGGTGPCQGNNNPPGCGTVFQFIPSTGTLNVLYNFTGGSDGLNPLIPPTPAPDGNLYGVTNSGSTYRIVLPSGTFQQLPNSIPGAGPIFGPLYSASDGNLYGVSTGGGAYSNGTVFRMTTTGAITIVHSFNGADGGYPTGPLTQPDINTLYGTTYQGGATGCGTVFKITLKGAFTSLHSFDCFTDGGSPVAGVVAASNGFLYGVNTGGGANAAGTLYQMSKTGKSFTNFYSFQSQVDPYATLVQHTNGILYGATWCGPDTLQCGVTGEGSLYTVTVPTPIPFVRMVGPIFVTPGTPVQLLGDNLTETVEVTFGGVQAQFSPQADTFLIAQVPTNSLDGYVDVTLASGLVLQTQLPIHMLPVITNLDPPQGPPGTQVLINGGGFMGAKKVTFGGVKAAQFSVQAPNIIEATVPRKAKTGYVTVTTPNGTATSPQIFTVN